MTREECIVDLLKELQVEVWRKTRYANNTGSCLWCSTDELVMVPDDENAAFYVQGKGDPDALMAKLEASLPDRLAERLDGDKETGATLTALENAPGAQAAVTAAVEALLAEGEQRGLHRARNILAAGIVSHFGPLPPMVARRIANANYDELEHWATRLGKVASAFMVVS